MSKFFRNKLVVIILAITALCAGLTVLTFSLDKKSDCDVVSSKYVDNCDVTGNVDDNLTLQTKEGVVTAIQSDCEAKQFIDREGRERQETEIICDGGSFISLDNVAIQTASGFVEEKDAFKVNIEGIKLRDRVRASYIQLTPTTGTLDCEECSLERLDN